MKKILTLVWMLTAFCGVSMADDTYTVVGAYLPGISWDENNKAGDMTQVGETTVFTKTFKGVTFNAKTTIAFKVIKNHSWDGNGWPETNYTHEFDPGVYDVTITFDTSNNTVGYSDLARMFIVYSTDYFTNHTVGDLMDYEDGVHTVSFNAVFDYCFLIVPSYALNAQQSAISDWSKVISPVADSWYWLYMQHNEGSVVTYENSKKWQIREAAKYTFTYNPSTSKFIVDAESTETITSAGWATYSLGSDWSTDYGFTVSNATAYYIAGTEGGKAVLTEIPSGTVIPNKAGVIVSGTGSFKVNTVGSAATNLADNKLIGSGVGTYDITGKYNDTDTYTGYIFADGANGVGFYKLNAEAGNTLAAHKAFLAIPTGTPLARDFFCLDDESTGINEIQNSLVQNDAIYNLQGVRLNKFQKGLNIVNGKKVMVK